MPAAGRLAAIVVLATACVRPDGAPPDSPSARSAAAPAESTRPDTAVTETRWLFDTVAAGDLVHASDSEADLQRRLGAENVRADTVWLPEGEFAIGTVLYPTDSSRRLDITWRDTVARARPEYVRLSGISRWRIAPGVGIGTSLAEIERLNGGAFELAGFGWDYGGTAGGWSGGRLEAFWGDHVIVRLQPADDAASALEAQVSGDRLFSSAHPAMRSLRPTVYEILIRPR